MATMEAEFDAPLDAIQKRVHDTFRDVRRILSFEDYLERVRAHPGRHLRHAARYLADMLEHFGVRKVERFGAQVDRFRLFDGEFPGCREFLCGEEEVQNEIYRIVKGLAEEGRTDKFILLHGPNGSSKTTVVNLLFRGLEHYSRTEAGALYRFNWIFPKPQSTEARLGFGGERGGKPGPEPSSYAFLEPEHVAARIPCELRDPPLLLIPREERTAFLESLAAGAAAGGHGDGGGDGGGEEPAWACPPWFLEGDLDPKSKAIFEGLLTAYHGDWKKVIRHVQVERYFISHRFRTGAVRIDPQMHVDAGVLQVAMDRSLEYLPPALQSIRILEPAGDLVDANHGVLEYSDFLSRPIDMNKYLLQTVETGLVSLPGLLLHLDLVLLGSTNEAHLDAFKKTLDYNSFQARMELVQVPYLLRTSDEAEIYRDVVAAAARRKPVLPHVTEVVALWAVLSRLRKPDKSRYPEALAGLMDRLTPLEKAKLYDRGETPAWMKDEARKLLIQAVGEVRREYEDDPLYEGRFGPSPREMRAILNEASHRKGFACLSPLAVLDVLEDFVKERNVYEFLNLEPDGRYHDYAQFIEVVRDEYHAWVTAELEEAMELIDTAEYDRKCHDYFQHVVAFSRGEKVENPNTGALEAPSHAVMDAVERLLDLQEPAPEFRKNLVARIGAFRVDHPDAPVVYAELFPDILAALRQDFFSRRHEQVEQVETELLRHLAGETGGRLPALADTVESTVRNLRHRFGVPEEGLRELILFVRKHRKLDPPASSRT